MAIGGDVREKIWTWQFSLFVGVACLALGLAAVYVSGSGPTPAVPTADTSAVAGGHPRGLTLAERANAQLDELDYPSAFRVARFVMSDDNGERAGVEMFALWAARHLQWSDVSVSEDETTFWSVRKDPAQQRGKRMCPSGQVLEIAPLEAGATYGRKLAEGLLRSDIGDLYRFFAAGDLAAIVAKSHARFCGVVTGRSVSLSVTNPPEQGVTVIGMFDLPKNRSGSL